MALGWGCLRLQGEGKGERGAPCLLVTPLCLLFQARWGKRLMAFDLNLHPQSGSCKPVVLSFLQLSRDLLARSHALPDCPRECPSQRLPTIGWLRAGKVMGLHS